jgi:hypothetical protein
MDFRDLTLQFLHLTNEESKPLRSLTCPGSCNSFYAKNNRKKFMQLKLYLVNNAKVLKKEFIYFQLCQYNLILIQHKTCQYDYTCVVGMVDRILAL